MTSSKLASPSSVPVGAGWRSRTERSSWRTPQMVKAHWCMARSLFSDVTFGNIPTTSIIATGDPIILKPLSTILSTGIMSLRCSLLHQNNDPHFNTVRHDFGELSLLKTPNFGENLEV